MHGKAQLSDAELAEVKSRRPGSLASLAIEGMCLTASEKALFNQMDDERLTADQRTQWIKDFCRAERNAKVLAAE